MKKKITAMVFVLIILAQSVLFAFTAQTKGTVIKTYNNHGVKNHVVMIDSEIVLIQKSVKGVKAGDNVLINIIIDGPNQPELSIIYNIIDNNLPIGARR